MNDNEYQNRLIFLTDAAPNRGDIEQNRLSERLNTTFVGIGIDLNTLLISSITKQRGANYFSIHDSKNFIRLLNNDFDLILTPLVFNARKRNSSQISLMSKKSMVHLTGTKANRANR